MFIFFWLKGLENNAIIAVYVKYSNTSHFSGQLNLTKKSDPANLISDVLWLALHSHPGNARQVDECQVRNVRGSNFQTDELITDPQSNSSHVILSCIEPTHAVSEHMEQVPVT